MDISKYGKHASSILTFLLEMGELPITALSKLGISPPSYYRAVSLLQDGGFVRKRIAIQGRKLVLVSLTDRGREIAQGLKALQQMDPIRVTEEDTSRMQELRLLYHMNVLDDHITIEEVPLSGGRPKIFNVYVKRNGHGDFRLWCEADESFDCVHVEVAWTYPQVQRMVLHYKGKTKICPACTYESPEDAKFCMECGARLE